MRRRRGTQDGCTGWTGADGEAFTEHGNRGAETEARKQKRGNRGTETEEQKQRSGNGGVEAEARKQRYGNRGAEAEAPAGFR